MVRIRRTLFVAIALVAALVPAPHPSGAATTLPATVGPQPYYLALGDDLAYGIQPDRDVNHGYANYFFSNLQPLGTTSLIDMGCPGETLETFMGNGQCPFPAALLKYHYQGPQLQAAISFIQQHPGQVSPVTVDIGANDFIGLFDPTTCQIITPTQGLTATIAQFDADYTSIFTQLQAALGGTGDLLAMNYYFPYQNLCYQRLGGNTPQFQALMALFEELNAHLQTDAQQSGVPWVDVFSAFGGATTPNPKLCLAMWSCLSAGAGFAPPTTTGYAVIAGGFAQTYGTAPTIVASTTQAVVGQTVAVTGTHFAAAEPVTVYWDSKTGSVLITATSGLDGSFTSTVTIPPATGGGHNLVAVGQNSRRQASTSIGIVPVLTLAPTQGPAGTVVQATGSGFGATEQVEVWWNSTTGILLGTTTSDAFGSFAGSTSVTFTVPVRFLGMHDIVAVGQSSGLQAQASFKVTP